MDNDRFDRLASEGHKKIPMCKRILADLDTPIGAYLKLADTPGSYLLESVEQGSQWGRYSIVGLPPRTTLRVSGQQVTVTTDGQCVESLEHEDPLAYIWDFLSKQRVAPRYDLPVFHGGLVGYFGYECARWGEKRLAERGDRKAAVDIPDIELALSEELLIFDNRERVLSVVTHVDPSERWAYIKGLDRLEQLAEQLREPSVESDELNPDVTPMRELRPEMVATNRGEHRRSVERIREYIVAGDVMQVVLSRHMRMPWSLGPTPLYRALRHLNPSPYMFLLRQQGFDIVGSSPETMARCHQGRVTLRPIAGTRPRGKTPEEDLRIEDQLLEDPKELSEHLMLVDLGRNDVGRVARHGSVEVTEYQLVERYSHVMHIVSSVCGKLRKGANPIDALRAALPAGTLSGAPKVRAMEIINELEPLRRGLYGGAVGYLAWNGDFDTAIAIRTAVLHEGNLHIHVGGGIVADSHPDSEWAETVNKAQALVDAARLAAACAND